jgi:hypothetical protein
VQAATKTQRPTSRQFWTVNASAIQMQFNVLVVQEAPSFHFQNNEKQ